MAVVKFEKFLPLLGIICLPITTITVQAAEINGQDIAPRYRAVTPKAEPEEGRKYRVQAEFAAQEKRNEQAINLYGKALEVMPWWTEGHYRRALILGEMKRYRQAMDEMELFLKLTPNAPEARNAQDKIYQWESVVDLPVEELTPITPQKAAVAVVTVKPGKVFVDCPKCPEMVELPSGKFEMGSDMGESDERPIHTVSVKGFAIGKTPVTQGQWRAVMGNNPSHFDACGQDCPVEQVSWDDAQKFIWKLNEMTGKRYRLPTEAEWEYACRAGQQQEYCGHESADVVAWHANNSGSFFFNSTHQVAKKKPNAFGLYDMSGNVWEWVADTYHDSYHGAPTDGSAWEGGTQRVLRGGSWGKSPQFIRASARKRFSAGYRDFSYGFRLARDL